MREIEDEYEAEKLRHTEPRKQRQQKVLNRALTEAERQSQQTYSQSNHSRAYRPESPKAEREVLSKLGEVTSQVADWMKKIEDKKAQLDVAEQELKEIDEKKHDRKLSEIYKLKETEEDK